jgi:hypothetical protein
MSFVPGTENPQVPSAVSEIFQPDQLIAGRYPLVSAEKVQLTGSAALPRGAVLGQATLPTGTATANAGNTGNGTVTAISLGEFAGLGTYTIAMLTATTFSVTAPNGDPLGNGVAGTQFNNQISFMLAAGGTAFIAGDGFTITGEAGSGVFKLSVASANDGSQTPCAILADYTDPTSGGVNVPGTVMAGIYYAGEFNANALTYDASWNTATLAPKLRAFNIYLKNSVSAAPVTASV